jgi:transcriptional regulator with XRE-family HTH domain
VAEPARDMLAVLIQQALDEGPFSMQQLAEQAGVSYDSLYSWAKGRRVPRAENLRQLAAGFDDRAEALRKVAEQLRKAAETV